MMTSLLLTWQCLAEIALKYNTLSSLHYTSHSCLMCPAPEVQKIKTAAQQHYHLLTLHSDA